MIGRHVRKVFSDPKVVFHSLRHNFRDAAREANLPQEVVGAIGGWKEGSHSAMAGPHARKPCRTFSCTCGNRDHSVVLTGLRLRYIHPP